MFSRFSRPNANGDVEVSLGCRSTVFVNRLYDDECSDRHVLVGLRSKTSLVLWSEKGPFHRMYDVLETWRERATDVSGKALAAGHFLPEQIPDQLTGEIKPFLTA